MSDKYQKATFYEATGEYFTPKIRLIYPALLEPRISNKYPNNPPKFSVTALVPKGADISALTSAVAKFCQGLYGDNWREKEVKLPIKKTDLFEKLAEFKDEYPFLIRASANADFPPYIIGPDTKPLVRRDHNEVYGGRWAVLALKLWGPKPANKDINRFCSLDVSRVQLLDHDDPIATGRINTAVGFDPAEAAAFGGGDEAGGTDALWQ